MTDPNLTVVPPRPPTVSGLVLERIRMLEQSLDELTAFIRAARMRHDLDLEQIRQSGKLIERSAILVAIALWVITALLGAILLTVLLK